MTNMTTRWSLGRRIAFRFGVVAGVAYLFPWPLGLIPKTEWIASVLHKPWDWGVPWFAEHVLRIDARHHVSTGSGDTLWMWVQLLMIVLLGAIGAIVWSIADRKRVAYPRLEAAAIVGLRYFLAAMLLSYGFVKIFPSQLPALQPTDYDQTFGAMSPMGLLWNFMGQSQPYVIFSGFAEALGGVLLLFRRTAIVGALVGAAVMTNVVMLNLCYDVPVKLFSMQLLLCAILIALPQAKRVLRALLGYATPEVAPRVRGSKRVERARLVAKLVVVAGMLHGAYQSYAYWREWPPKTALHGAWVVETFTLDGVERAPLITDETRWRKLLVSQYGLQLRAMTDERRWLRDAKIDDRAGTITFAGGTLRYTRPDAEHLVIDGVLDGKQLHVTLAKEPEPLLSSRGFHWIQEFPFNR